MSIYGEWLAATIAASGTDSSEVNLGKDFDFIEIQIPTMDACTVKIQVAESSGGTFYNLGDAQTTTSGTHNYADVFKLGGYQFIKVIASAAQSSGAVAIRVRGMRF